MIGTTHEKEEQRKKVNLVNKLIEETFGEGFSGNWFSCDTINKSWFPEGFEQKNELNQIRKKGFGTFNTGDTPYVAIFSKKDGSSMTVFPEYYISAVKYSILYEQIFGEKVEIRAHEGQDLY